MSPITLKTLSALRVLIGASCLFIPRQAGMLFGVPLSPGPEGVLLGRMAGVRDIVLGAYLWKRVQALEEVVRGDAGTATGSAHMGAVDQTRASLLVNKFSSGKDGVGQGDGSGSLIGLQMAEREAALRSAVWLNLVVDTVDVVSVIMGSLEASPLSDLAKVTIGAGAVGFALIAGQHLVAHRRG